MTPRSILTATRKEVDLPLKVINGLIPNDLSGFVYINSAAATVNTPQGLPIPPNYPDGKPIQEYCTPIINGDGLMYQYDLSQEGKVSLKSRMFRTPCYWADEGTKRGSKWHKKYGFKNLGLARISPKMGTRNQVNTAIAPVRFPGDSSTRLLATFDAGRPFEFDPKSLELITPIGRNEEWHGGTPPFMHQPFMMALTTAHPIFDPATKELFTVNFIKTTAALMSATTIFSWLGDEEDEKALEEKLIEHIRLHPHEKFSREELILKTEIFFAELDNKFLKKGSLLEKIWAWFKKVFLKNKNPFSNENSVFLLKWTGKGDFEKWEVVDEKGNGILIHQNMHQIGFSKDYIVLIDASFKFSLDVMLYNVLPQHQEIDAFLRKLTSGAMLDHTDIYIVKRADLTGKNKKVKAKKITIPVETVHFSTNYLNPNGILTLHTAHNCAACPAEWLRSYDKKMTDPTSPIDKNKIGLLAVGEMDIGKIGRVVIDAEKGKYLEKESAYYYAPHPDEEFKQDQAHTWGVGLYTHRDLVSADNTTDKITHIYWQSYGLSDDLLTEFIYWLYEDYTTHRVFQPKQIVEATRKGAPFVLSCVDTEQMKATDHYTFDKETYLWSLQFVPRKHRHDNVPYYQDGYIFTTVIVGKELPSGEWDYRPQIWIFDGTDLKKGPLCQLGHPDLDFGFTIHSAWIPDASTSPNKSYIIDIKEDYDYMLKKVNKKQEQKDMREIFEQYVYPRFKTKKA